jgi:hypothetical protein
MTGATFGALMLTAHSVLHSTDCTALHCTAGQPVWQLLHFVEVATLCIAPALPLLPLTLYLACK